MKLVNVRLSDEDAAKAAELRRHGVELSEVVREALRARHLALRPRLRSGDVRAMHQRARRAVAAEKQAAITTIPTVDIRKSKVNNRKQSHSSSNLTRLAQAG